jgi:flavin-dependent dehydrogenase
MNARTIAIIGGGPAGARTAEALACSGAERTAVGAGLASAEGTSESRAPSLLRPSRGLRVVVFEEKVGWEKPCGGGLTPKALRRYPFLADAAGEGNLIHEVEFIAPTGAALRFHLPAPLAVYSRATLDRLLLHRAERAGAKIVADRILRLRRLASGWEMEGLRKTYRADFVVLAAGARTRLRETLTENLAPRDFMLTFGYYLPGPCPSLRVRFYENFEGYAWAFPRRDHVSVGICGKLGEEPMARLRERLNTFMQESGYAPDPARKFSHLLPSLAVESWGNLRLAGRGWALVGDAAGLVDPITGEGIYYAMRSGDLLAEALLEGVPELYPERVRNEFGRALTLGARLSRIFYRGKFLGGGVTTRMIEFGKHSDALLEVVQDLVEGSQSYLGLIMRLLPALPGAIVATALMPANARSFAVNPK